VPSKDPIQRFEDILENINRIEDFTAAAHEGPELARISHRGLAKSRFFWHN
jgi:uncharacterized protein with HEPN domain